MGWRNHENQAVAAENQPLVHRAVILKPHLLVRSGCVATGIFLSTFGGGRYHYELSSSVEDVDSVRLGHQTLLQIFPASHNIRHPRSRIELRGVGDSVL